MKTVRAYRFKITKGIKVALAEVSPELVETAIAGELEAFARAITPQGMADPEIKIEHLGIAEIQTSR